MTRFETITIAAMAAIVQNDVGMDFTSTEVAEMACRYADALAFQFNERDKRDNELWYQENVKGSK